MRAALRLLALVAASAGAAQAQDRKDNEALVMRLIFQDCLGYVRDGTAPFADLALAPLRPEVEMRLVPAVRQLPDRHQLLSGRYYAYWGQTATDRLCVISAADDFASFPALLTVWPEGFLDRMTRRAAAEGLSEHDLPATFDMFGTPMWSEPGDDPAELRIVTIPYEPRIAGVPIDMGIIIVAVGIKTEPSS